MNYIVTIHVLGLAVCITCIVQAVSTYTNKLDNPDNMRFYVGMALAISAGSSLIACFINNAIFSTIFLAIGVLILIAYAIYGTFIQNQTRTVMKYIHAKLYLKYAKEGEFKISSTEMKFIEHSFSTVPDFLKAPLKYTYAKVLEYVDGSTEAEKHKAHTIGELQFFNFKKYKKFINKQIRKQSKQKGA